MHNLKSGRTLYDSGGIWQALNGILPRSFSKQEFIAVNKAGK
jgi:hypothetical protein